MVAFEIDTKVLDKIISDVSSKKIKPLIIHDGVEYGVIQELTDAGHPSLIPAFESNVKEMGPAIGEAIEKGVDLNDVLKVTAFNVQTDWASDVSVDTGAYKNSIRVSEE